MLLGRRTSALRRLAPSIAGVLVGAACSLLLVNRPPSTRSCEPRTGAPFDALTQPAAPAQRAADPPYSLAARATFDDALARIRPKADASFRRPQVNASLLVRPTIVRPRFYSTELEIKEKLLAVVLGHWRSLETLGTALNRTLTSHVSKLIFYVCVDEGRNNADIAKTLKPNVVIVAANCNSLFLHVLHHIAERGLSREYDFVFFARDTTFVRGENLMSLASHISISQEVYMGVPMSTDPRACSLDAGILFSRITLEKVLANAHQCAPPVRPSPPMSPSERSRDLLLCLSKFAGVSCQHTLGSGRAYVSVSSAAGQWWSPTTANCSSSEAQRLLYQEELQQRPVITVAPLRLPDDFYRLNQYLDGQTSRKVRNQLVGIAKAISELTAKNALLPNDWPPDVRPAFKAGRRFEVVRTTYFNRTHLFWPTDASVLARLDDLDLKDLDDVMEVCAALAKRQRRELRLVDGWRTVDPTSGVRYVIDARLTARAANDAAPVHDVSSVTRCEVVRPLSLTEFVPMPFVDENRRVTVVLPVHDSETRETISFLERFEVLINRREHATLILVFLLREQASNAGFTSVQHAVGSLLQRYSNVSYRKRFRIILLQLRCPEGPPPEFSITDIVASKLPRDELMLFVQPNAVFSSNFLNRVRMNTIRGSQAFIPVPFVLFNPWLQTLVAEGEAARQRSLRQRYHRVQQHQQHQRQQQRPASVMSKDAGFFDTQYLDVLSLFNEDYHKLRSTLRHVPFFFTSAELHTRVSPNLTFGLAELMLISKTIHVLRAVEPELRLEFMQRKCDHVASNSRQRSHCVRLSQLSLGSKRQLAAYLAQHAHKHDQSTS